MDPPPPGGDEKWKLSKKGRSRSGRPHAMDAGSSVLSRSYSASVSTTRASSSSSSSSSGSSCQQGQQKQQQHGSSSSSSSRGLSKKKKCVDAVKEHRARFYIVRRCVSMLVCWRDY
ncbi:unnamed protein product [Urochloa decumbens]|uniref:Uncharacterized protein n=1 Tax=Urochloa decumbens TaxID=240449 RepID=A0ABC9GW42_9POAL